MNFEFAAPLENFYVKRIDVLNYSQISPSHLKILAEAAKQKRESKTENAVLFAVRY